MSNFDELDLSTPPISRPSKGSMKRDMVRLQEIGRSLVELPQGKFAKVDIPEKLRTAIVEARRLTVMGAKRRQMQYIGRIMEEFDVTSISRQLSSIDHAPAKPKKSQDAGQIETLKNLILGDDATLFALLSSKLDVTQISEIRTLVRNAKKELTQGKNDISTIAKKLASEFATFDLKL